MGSFQTKPPPPNSLSLALDAPLHLPSSAYDPPHLGNCFTSRPVSFLGTPWLHDVAREALSLAVHTRTCPSVRARARVPLAGLEGGGVSTPTRSAAALLGCDWLQGGDSFCHDLGRSPNQEDTGRSSPAFTEVPTGGDGVHSGGGGGGED